MLVFWFIRGKKFFKNKLAESIDLDPNELPYRQSVIEFIHKKKSNGAKIYLVTATHQKVARRINEVLNLFDEVYASNSTINLRGKSKADFLKERFGVYAFEYLGDSRKDIPVWNISARNYIVTSSSNLKKKVSKMPNFGGLIGSEPAGTFRYIKLIRLHQWVKNLLLFLPPLLAHTFVLNVMFRAVLSFLAFSFVASAIYILNDFFDIKTDRLHPLKRHRPIPSGNVDLTTSLIIFLLLLGIGILLSVYISMNFLLIIFLYILLNIAYSLFLKTISLVDIFVLSFFYAIRIYAGGFGTSVSVSNWLIAFSIFFFLSLSSLKRFSEMNFVFNSAESKSYNRPYLISHLDFILIFGIASAFSSVVIFILYINSPIVLNFYRNPSFLWFVAFLLLFWLINAWNNAKLGKISGDPVLFLLKEKLSIIVLFFILIFWLFASLGL